MSRDALVHGAVAENVREKFSALEAETLDRVIALSEAAEVRDPEYATGIELAVATALNFGLDSICNSESDEPPVPASLYAQARRAARAEVDLDAVLRRYAAGSAVLFSHLLSQLDSPVMNGIGDLHRLFVRQATALDRLLAAVGHEFRQEQSEMSSTAKAWLERRVLELLAGRSTDVGHIPYDFDSANHVGIVVAGMGPVAALRTWASDHDTRVLVVRADRDLVWAWMGSRRMITGEDCESLLGHLHDTGARSAIGEPAQGIKGWKLTHLQAKTAWTLVLRGHLQIARYSEVALSASILRDPVLAASLTRSYLEPLAAQNGGGAELRATLRAYLAHGQNMSAAAAALRIGRHTVRRRLEAAEECLGCSVSGHAMEIDGALRLEEILGGPHDPRSA